MIVHNTDDAFTKSYHISYVIKYISITGSWDGVYSLQFLKCEMINKFIIQSMDLLFQSKESGCYDLHYPPCVEIISDKIAHPFNGTRPS